MTNTFSSEGGDISRLKLNLFMNLVVLQDKYLKDITAFSFNHSLNRTTLARSSALQVSSLALLPDSLSSHTYFRQVEMSQAAGCSQDSGSYFYNISFKKILRVK